MRRILKPTRMISIFTVLITCLANWTLGQQTANLTDLFKIQILKSSREDVEKLFGESRNPERNVQGTSKRSYFQIYDLSNATAFVTFSSGDCSSKTPIWDAPEWTVTEVEYSPDEGTVKLADVISKMPSHKARQAGDVVSHKEFFDDSLGISVVYDQDLKIVLHITLYPSKKMKSLYDCDRGSGK